MSRWGTKLAASIGCLGAGAYGLLFFANPFNTPTTREVESRMTSAGGRPKSAPGTATPLGNENNVKPSQENHSGPDTGRFPLNQGATRPFKDAKISERWNEVQAGNNQGK